MGKEIQQWSDMIVGQTYRGSISKVLEDQQKILIKLGDKINGILDSMNISDKGQVSVVSKRLKEQSEIEVKILSIDRDNKRCYLTIKPSLMNDEDNLNLIDRSLANIGDCFNGTILKQTDQGFLIRFFNNITGLLTFKDIEDINGSSRSKYEIGQTIKVYIQYKNENKLGLSLSSETKSSRQSLEQIAKQISQTKNLSIPSQVILGSVFDFEVLNKESGSDYLLLKNKTLKFKAFLHRSHVNDFEQHSLKIMESLKKLNNPIKCLVIGVTEENHVIVTYKESLINQKNHPNSLNDLQQGHSYFGYVSKVTSTGISVKFNEKLQGFVLKQFLLCQENLSDAYPLNKTINVQVHKIEGNKIMLNALIKQCDLMSFLKEEHNLIKQHLKKMSWKELKIGNFIEGKVNFIKDYGLILQIKNHDGITGFIINENLVNQNKKVYKDKQLICRILDIDYEKEILDLVEEQTEKNQKLQKKDYNYEKIIKYGISNIQSKLSATVLLNKDNYIVAKLNNYPKVICYNERVKEMCIYNSVFIKSNVRNNKKIQTQILLKIFNTVFFFKYIDCNGKIKNRQIIFIILLLLYLLQLIDQNFLDLNIIKYLQIYMVLQIICLISNLDKNQKYEIHSKIKKIQILNENQLQANSLDKCQFLIIGQEQNQKEETSVGEKKQVGDRVLGVVSNIKQNFIFVTVSTKLHGRIHKSQIENFDDIIKKQNIEVKILSQKDGNTEFTCLKAHMDIKNNGLDKLSLLPENASQINKEQSYQAVIKSIQPQSVTPLYVELSGSQNGSLNAFTGLFNIDSQESNIASLTETYKVGQIIHVKINNITQQDNYLNYDVRLSNLPVHKNLEVGSLVVARVVNKSDQGYKIQFSKNQFGQVEITDVSDEWVAQPLNQYKVNSFVKARILSMNDNKIQLSLRQSLTQDKIYQALSSEGTTIQYKKCFGELEKNGDLRARIFKYGYEGLKKDMIVMGYVRQLNDKGCFVRIANGTVARAGQGDLSDIHLENPNQYFYTNRLVLARIISIKQDGKIDISLRESVVKSGFQLTLDTIKVGTIVKGCVVGHLKEKKASIQINGCKFRATLSMNDFLEEMPEEQLNVLKILPLGMKVNAVVVKYTSKPHIKIKLSALKSQIAKLGLKNQMEVESENYLNELWKSVQETSANVIFQSEIQAQSIQKNQMEIEKENDNQDDDNDDDDDIDDDGQSVDNDSDDENIDTGALYKDEDLDGEDDDDDNNDNIIDQESFDDENVDEDDDVEDDDVEDDDNSLLKKRKLNQKNKEKSRVKKELQIREQEMKLMDQTRKPETDKDFERLILQDPNSSFIWINYVAHKLQTDGIKGGRNLIERALRVINFKNENDQMNLWTSFLNMEYTFGSEKHVTQVFERALKANNPKKIYMKLIEIYYRDYKFDIIEELCQKMIKKFKSSSKVWLEYISKMIDYKKHLEESKKDSDKINVKQILQRAMQSIKKKKHVEVLSQYARLEFIKGDAEKGRSTYEALIQSYPKRTDIWSVYLDMEIKNGNKDIIRNLFERCISLKLKTKKIKFFFKRYLEFEISQGDIKKIEAVKEKATQYVESIINQEDQENDQEDEQ